MYQKTPFLIYIAVFILTWPAHFAARGIPKTRNELCLERGYLIACEFRADRKPCQVLTCGFRKAVVYRFHELILINGVPDYTECGELKICMKGECVDTNGPMPHYRSRIRYAQCQEVYRLSGNNVPTRHEQCKNYGFDVACEADDEPIDVDCTALKCGYEGASGFYFRRSLEKLPIPLVPYLGTWCGDNKACIYGVCMPLAQWPQPSQFRRLPTYRCPEIFDMCCAEIEN